MRTFAEKPKANQRATSPKATAQTRSNFGHSHGVNSILPHQRMIGNQAVQRMLRADAHKAELIGPTLPRFGHDFSGMPLRSPAAGAIQTKLAINKRGTNTNRKQIASLNRLRVCHRPLVFARDLVLSVRESKNILHSGASHSFNASKVRMWGTLLYHLSFTKPFGRLISHLMNLHAATLNRVSAMTSATCACIPEGLRHGRRRLLAHRPTHLEKTWSLARESTPRTRMLADS